MKNKRSSTKFHYTFLPTWQGTTRNSLGEVVLAPRKNSFTYKKNPGGFGTVGRIGAEHGQRSAYEKRPIILAFGEHFP